MLSRQGVLSAQFSFRNFAALAQSSSEKDYYTILGVPTHATSEDIKDAYRKLAKVHHPDVRTAAPGEKHDPDVEKFRDVVEAYQVLSVRESRAAFDLSRRKNPDLYKPMSDEQYNMLYRRDMRDKGGMTPKSPYPRGSYAEFRMKELA